MASLIAKQAISTFQKYIGLKRATQSHTKRSMWKNCANVPLSLRCVPLSTSSSEQSKKPAKLVTTPIFYVNSEPHIGHLHSTLLADAVSSTKK